MPTPKKRVTTKKSTSTKKKRRAKKPKVKLSAQKVYLLSGIIILLCAVSLVFSVVMANKHPSPQQTAQPTQTESAQASETQNQNAVAKQAAKNEVKTQIAATQQKNAPAQTTSSASQQKQSATANAASAAQTTSTAANHIAPSTPIVPPNPEDALASAKADKTDLANTAENIPPQKPASPEKQTSPFAIPPAKNGATLAFVIDDAGQNVNNVKKYTVLPFPLAIAVLPRLSQTKECAAEIRRAGKELMLHQPMQAHAYPNGKMPNPGQGAILPDMTTTEIAATIKQNLDEIAPSVKGFNNHEGSLVTENEIKMGAVLEVALERGIYFLDSRTTKNSAVPQAALERDMRYIARYAPFLDNVVDREAMLTELYAGLEVANKNGYAIIIGHVDKSADILPKLLTDIYPYLVQAGYTFAVPSQLR